MFYSRCVCSVSALFLPPFFFFFVSESYSAINGVSDSLRDLGIEDIECPVPGSWTVTIRDVQFCPFIFNTHISRFSVSTCKWGWNFSFLKSLLNSELASLSFCVLLWFLSERLKQPVGGRWSLGNKVTLLYGHVDGFTPASWQNTNWTFSRVE